MAGAGWRKIEGEICQQRPRTSWRENCRRRMRSRTSWGKVLPAKAASSSRLWKLPSPLLALLCSAHSMQSVHCIALGLSPTSRRTMWGLVGLQTSRCSQRTGTHTVYLALQPCNHMPAVTCRRPWRHAPRRPRQNARAAGRWPCTQHCVDNWQLATSALDALMLY